MICCVLNGKRKENNMNDGLTVKDLFELCKEQIDKGNGDKRILLSDDDEGNGFHTLFYGFDDSDSIIEYALELEHDSHNADEIIILG